MGPEFITNTRVDTPRLILEGFTPSDLQRLFSDHSASEIQTILGVDEHGYGHYRNMVDGGMETFRLSAIMFLMRQRDTGTIIGECGFHTWNRTHRKAELFYAMRDDMFKRKGFATEAVEYLLGYGFTHMQLHRVEAKVASANVPSVRILQRFGFVHEGILRQDYVVDGINEDSEMHSLLQSEWHRHMAENGMGAV
ncbi:MAG: GNAT family N-acetyltransferase [Flavobacteriales bacterium]|nr:GNAT family N-acetyltransferase [Flavobacteriales bacterium]